MSHASAIASLGQVFQTYWLFSLSFSSNSWFSFPAIICISESLHQVRLISNQSPWTVLVWSNHLSGFYTPLTVQVSTRNIFETIPSSWAQIFSNLQSVTSSITSVSYSRIVTVPLMLSSYRALDLFHQSSPM